jgi:hypothetical protein
VTDLVYARHVPCKTPLEWRRCGESILEGASHVREMGLWCPKCNCAVPLSAATTRGPFAGHREPKETDGR